MSETSNNKSVLQAVHHTFPDDMFNHRDLALRAIRCAEDGDWMGFEELVRRFFPEGEKSVRQICRNHGLTRNGQRPKPRCRIMPGGWRLAIHR